MYVSERYYWDRLPPQLDQKLPKLPVGIGFQNWKKSNLPPMSSHLPGMINPNANQPTKNDQPLKIPTEFVCSITKEIMRDPVFTLDGITYEKSAITDWLKTNDTSPHTGKKLENKQLIPNVNLKNQIQQFVQNNQEAFKKEFVNMIKGNNLKKLDIFLGLGLQANMEINGYSPVCYAILYERNDITQLFLAKGVSTNLPALDYSKEPELNRVVNFRNQKLRATEPFKLFKKKIRSDMIALYEKLKTISEITNLYNKLDNFISAFQIKGPYEFNREHFDKCFRFNRYDDYADLTTQFSQWTELSRLLGFKDEDVVPNSEGKSELTNLKERKIQLELKLPTVRKEFDLLMIAYGTTELLLEKKYKFPGIDFSSLESLSNSKDKTTLTLESGSNKSRESRSYQRSWEYEFLDEYKYRDVCYPKLNKIIEEINSLTYQIEVLKKSSPTESCLKLNVSNARLGKSDCQSCLYALKNKLEKIAFPACKEKIAEYSGICHELNELHKQRNLFKFNVKESQVKLIHLAAFFGQQTILNGLIRKNIDVNVVDEFGFTALHWAAINNQGRCIEILLNHEALVKNDHLNCTFHHYCVPETLKNINLKPNLPLESKNRKLEEKLEDQEIQLKILKENVEKLTNLVSQLLPRPVGSTPRIEDFAQPHLLGVPPSLGKS